MEIVSTTALISINGTLIAQLVSFLIFLFIVNRIMIRPLQDSMAERSDHIEQIKQDIIDAEEDVRRFAAEVEERKSAVRTEAFQIANTLEESGSKRADEIFASAKEEIEALRAEAAADIDAKLAEARKHIKSESETLAVSVMEKILDRRLAS
jgi:F-type H+-transporting ATPase subunit b